MLQQCVVALCCSTVLQHCVAAVWCSNMLHQCVAAVCCSSMLQLYAAAACCSASTSQPPHKPFQCVAVVLCSSVLKQRVAAVCCSSVLWQCVAAVCCSSVLQHYAASACCSSVLQCVNITATMLYGVLQQCVAAVCCSSVWQQYVPMRHNAICVTTACTIWQCAVFICTYKYYKYCLYIHINTATIQYECTRVAQLQHIRVAVQHKGRHSCFTLPLCKWLSQKLQCQLRMSVTNGSYFCSGIRVTHTATHSATHTATHNVTRNALQQYVAAVCRNCYTYCCSTLLQHTNAAATHCCITLLQHAITILLSTLIIVIKATMFISALIDCADLSARSSD